MSSVPGRQQQKNSDLRAMLALYHAGRARGRRQIDMMEKLVNFIRIRTVRRFDKPA
jgi:hypothetical protein